MNKDILLWQYMAIADMVDASLFWNQEEVEQAILRVRNNELPF